MANRCPTPKVLKFVLQVTMTRDGSTFEERKLPFRGQIDGDSIEGTLVSPSGSSKALEEYLAEHPGATREARFIWVMQYDGPISGPPTDQARKELRVDGD